MYQYSMTQWIVGNEKIEHSFERLKKYGYDGIEFAAEPYTTDQDKMVRLLKEYGLSCTSLCGIFPEDRDLTADDPDEAARAVQYIKDNVDFAKKVGAPYMIVVPSPVGRTEPLPNRSYERAWTNAVRNVKAAAEYAESQGIRLAIEAINRYETYLVNTLTKALSFVKEVNHPAVGLMADMFHMSLEENNIGASLRMIAPYLMHVHAADNTREAAGLGNTDFKEMFYVLRDIGYQGPITMEFMPRLANPYASGDVETQAKAMDRYAEQAIHYLKELEKSVM
jgi:D-psicose/D-tagatose/L-ribulose 3-epimerase